MWQAGRCITQCYVSCLQSMLSTGIAHHCSMPHSPPMLHLAEEESARLGQGLSQHLRSHCSVLSCVLSATVFQKPNSISNCFQNVKAIKSPRGRDEPRVACLWLEMRLLEIWAFALTFEGSREGTVLHGCCKCMAGFIPSKYGQDSKALPQAISPEDTFLHMSKGHHSLCQLPVRLHSGRR